MATMAENAVRWMRARSKATRGVLVAYRRKETGAVVENITAVPGASPTEVHQENSVVPGKKLRDFLIDVADLGVEPERGDQIVWGDTVYVVTFPGGANVWEWHDNYETSYRIFTIESPERAALERLPYGTSTGEQYGTFTDEIYGPAE